MKTFVAVLAAGAIIFAAFVGWQRLDRWEQAKAYWMAQFHQAQANMPRGCAAKFYAHYFGGNQSCSGSKCITRISFLGHVYHK
jgi:hypothetical protein